MKNLLIIGSFVWVLTSVGCNSRFFAPDVTPPSAPQNISTVTGDHQVEIYWSRNTEHDLNGYHVFVSDAYDGKYELIGTTRQNHFIDGAARNGTTYYYAVSAFDFAGNESPLSIDLAYDTPRPEGYDVILKDYRSSPNLSGYDFSTYSIGPYNDEYTDVFFEYYNGATYLNVWTDSDIQDMGYTESLYDIGTAPIAGWSPSKDVRVITGHTYVVWTWDDHYAKIRINAVSTTRVQYDWAYQLQQGNTELKHGAIGARGTLEMGSGAASRF